MQGLGIARSLRTITLVALWCAAASTAGAQSDTAAGHSGLHFSLGGAEATTVGACSGCTGFGQLGTEFSLMLRVGGAVLPNVVLSADLSAWEFDRRRGSESGTWELVTAQYYPSLHRGLYLSAGIGLAQFEYDGPRSIDGLNEFSHRNGLGLTGGVGYDLHVSGSFFLSPSIDMLYLQQIGSIRGIRQTPAVFRAGVSVVREPHGAIAREESKKYEGHHGLEVALGVGEGAKPASCAGCAGWGGPAGGAVFMGRAGWAVSPGIVVSADVTAWQRGVGRANESAVWQMIATQYYPDPRAGLYFDAGVGRAVDAFHVDGYPYLYPPVVDAITHSLGLSFGIGYEDSPRGFFSMTPSLTVLYAVPQRTTNTPGGARLGTTLISAGVELAWR